MKEQKTLVSKRKKTVFPSAFLVFVFVILLYQISRWHAYLSSSDSQSTIDEGWVPVTSLGEEVSSATAAGYDHHSWVHCVGDNFLPSAWSYRSCQYRNICYSHDTQKWLLYPSPAALRSQYKWENTAHKYARKSTSFREADLMVLPMAVHPSHLRAVRRQQQQQNIFQDTTVLWNPTILHPSKRHRPPRDVKDRIAIPIRISAAILPSDDTNYSDFALVTQVLIPIYNLLGLFGWEEEAGGHVDVILLDEDALCTANCQSWLRAGIQDLIGYHMTLNVPPPSPPGNSTCYARGAAGMGFLSVHGLSKRGADEKDYREPGAMPNAGRGATFYDFVKRVWKQHNLTITNDSSEKIVIVRLVVPEIGIKEDKQWVESLANAFDAAFKKATFVRTEPVQSHDLALSSTITKWVYMARRSNVWVAVADENAHAWPALFMPRGSTLLLLYDPNRTPSRGTSNHAVFQDFHFWNHVSHLQVHWLAMPRTSLEWNRFSDTIKSLILKDPVETAGPIGFRSKTNDALALFQNHPLRSTSHSSLPRMRAHCLGQNWEWDDANYRSCHVENLCFDTINKDFVVAKEPSARSSDASSVDILANELRPVMMGQSIRLGNAEPWSPRRVGPNLSSSFYALPPDILWLPYYADVPNANNPGHLLWDFLLPLYTLMELYFDERPLLLLTNLDSDCIANKTKNACYRLTGKFLPLLGVHEDSFTNAQGAFLQGSNQNGFPLINPSSDFVCSSHAAFGIGMLTDHGTKKHGQLIEDYQILRNAGRGVAFWRFRNYMLSNLPFNFLQAATRPSIKDDLLVVTFSINSSQNPSRKRNFMLQIQALQQHFSTRKVVVKAVEIGKLSLEEQISIILQSSVFVSTIGGATSTAMFLRRNACLILYFNDQDDFVRNKKGGVANIPAMLDFDFWNNASYLRVQWLPLSTMDNPQDVDLLISLIEDELAARW